MAPPQQQAAKPLTIEIDGKEYSADDLTFGEQREFRAMVRELSEDPTITLGEAQLMDFLPALVWVIVKRDKPDFSIEDALEQKYADVFKPETGKRPTKARSTRATS
jgi:hypothetical protein